MMRTLDRVESARRYARWGIVVGYGLSLVVFIVRLVGASPRVPENLWGVAGAGAVAGVFAISPTVAVLALRGRPRLLPLASTLAFLTLFTATAFGLAMVVSAMLWLRASARWPRPVRTRWPRIVLWPIVVVLAAGSFVMLFAHLDPLCAHWYDNGRVETWVPTKGFASGWAWEGAGGSIIGGEFAVTGGDHTEREECTSDIITWWEALISLGLAGGAVAVAAVGGAKASES